MKMNETKIPKSVTHILNKLNEHGYEGYIVGGAVRDYVMGNEPHDWDIATNAKPEQVKAIFSKTIDTGIKHGTVTAMMAGTGYEITTYRCDGKYSDGRHPDDVSFVDSIEEDLARRDFTINAMAMDAEGNIVDPFGGLDDIKKGVIRCVGNPDDRFSEDALRMMRAVRFESKFGFELDDETKKSIEHNADKIQNVSAERIRDEFTKMLVSDNPKKGFIDAYKTGLTARVMPEFNAIMECEQNSPWHYANAGIHTLDAVETIDADPNLRWAMLMHDMGKPVVKTQNSKGFDSFVGHAPESKQIAKDIMTRLKFSNKDAYEISDLVGEHDTIHKRPSSTRLFAAKYGDDFLTKLGKMKEADSKAHAPEYVDELLTLHGEFISRAKGFIADGTAIKPSELRINGNELQEYGIKGKAIGEFLKDAYRDCLGQPELNNNELLRRRAERLADKEAKKQQFRENAAADVVRDITTNDRQLGS